MLAKTVKQNVCVEYQIFKWLKTVSFADFYGEISKRVIGQDEALSLVLAEVRAYIEGLVYGQSTGTNRHNLIIAAGSGAGKTETYRALRDYFRDAIPGFMVTIYDVSGLTAAGFKGQEPSDVLLPYFRARMADAFGICFLDELDKKIAPAYSSTGENINAEVQGQLLTMIEGGDVYDKRGMKVNTEHMMFIGLGSFSAFRQTREQTPRRVGILAGNEREEEAERNDHFAPLTAEDMVEAGGSWELLGRFSSIINYRKLDRTAIRRIIEKTMQHEANVMGIDLDVEEEAVDELTEIVEDSKFGCRFIYSKLHSIIMRTYSNALLEMPEDSQMTVKIHTLDDVSYKFTAYTPEDKQNEEEFIAKLKAKEETLKEEAAKAPDDDDNWMNDLIGLWE